MITIDGSQGEGGGQILRSALTLSALTGQPFQIDSIRAGRAKPGLLRQHFTALQAAAAVCGGKYSDTARLGATSLQFYPGDIRAGTFEFAVGTAGSAMLVLQTVLLPLLSADAPSRLVVSGGTHNPAAPPFEFIERAFLPLLARMGASVDLKLARYGFMPAGGGRIVVDVAPSDGLQPLEIADERGERTATDVEAIFANLPLDIAQRERAGAGAALGIPENRRHLREVKSDGPGNAVVVTVRHEAMTEVFTAFGRRGIRAEEVAANAADEAKRYLKRAAPVGPHLADQLLLPMALSGGGRFTATEATPHAKSNARIIAQFLDVAIDFRATYQGTSVEIAPKRRMV